MVRRSVRAFEAAGSAGLQVSGVLGPRGQKKSRPDEGRL